MLFRHPSPALRLVITFAITFFAVFGTYTLAYTYPNIPIVLVESTILGIMMTLCRVSDRQPNLRPLQYFTFIIETIVLWVVSIPLFNFLPIDHFYARKWALAFSALVCGFHFCLSRSFENSKWKLLLPPFFVGGLSTIPIFMNLIGYVPDSSSRGSAMAQGITLLLIYLPPVVAIWSVVMTYLEYRVVQLDLPGQLGSRVH